MKNLSLTRLLAQSSLLVAARVGGACVAFAGNVLIARWFGADALGIVALSMAVVALLAVLMPAGRQAVGMLFVPQYLAQKKPGHIRGFVLTGYRNIAISTALIFAVFALAIPFAAGAAREDQILAVAFACLMAPAVALINFNGGFLTGARRPLLGLVPDLLVKPVMVWVAIAALALLAPAAAPHILLAGICAALWTTAALQALAIRQQRQLPRTKSVVTDAKRWRQVALPWIPIILLSDNIIELHLLMAGLIMSPAKVGILYICFRLRMLASFGMRALYALVLPDIYAGHAQGDAAIVRQNLSRTNALALVIAVTVCVAVALTGADVLGLLGAEFRDGQTALLIVCLSMIPRAIFGPATEIMATAGRQRHMISIMLAGIVLSMGIGLATYPSLGIDGVAAGYSIAVGAIAAAQWWWTKRLTGIDCSILSAMTHGRQPAHRAVAADGLGSGSS